MTLLRDGGVEVVVADSIADVEQAARPDTLILVAQSQYLTDDTRWTGWPKPPAICCWSNRPREPAQALMPGRAHLGRQHLRQQAELRSAGGQSGRIGSLRAKRHLRRPKTAGQ